MELTIIDGICVMALVLIGWVAQRVTIYMKKEGMLAELENKKEYIQIAVQAAEQMYQSAGGPEKFKQVKKNAVKYLNEKKIAFTEDELEQLIEASVKSMKNGIKKGSES